MKATEKQSLTPFTHSAQNKCFGCGPANSGGLHLEFFIAQDGSVVCPATIAEIFQGPTGYLHGGIIATLLDETMSKAVRAQGVTAMTRRLEVDYRRPYLPANRFVWRAALCVAKGASAGLKQRSLTPKGYYWRMAQVFSSKFKGPGTQNEWTGAGWLSLTPIDRDRPKGVSSRTEKTE